MSSVRASIGFLSRVAAVSLALVSPVSAVVEFTVDAPASVEYGATSQLIHIRLSNNPEVLTAIDLPLEIRRSGGASITAIGISYSERLLGPVISDFAERKYHLPDGLVCFYATSTDIPAKIGVPPGPVGVRFHRETTGGTPTLNPGVDVVGSFVLDLDFNSSSGTIEIDTTCMDPGIHPRVIDSDGTNVPIVFNKATISLVPPALDTFWVAINGSNVPTAGTESNPFLTIQYALSQIPLDAAVVIVKPGTYQGPISFPSGKAVSLVSQSGPFQTTILGDGNMSIVTLDAGSAGVAQTIEGFTLRDNFAQGALQPGAVLVNWPTMGSILRCVISGNSALEAPGGILYFGLDGQVVGNWIVDNSVVLGPSWPGGAYFATDARATVVNNTFANNVGVGFNGGGVAIIDTSSVVQFDNNIIAFNGLGSTEQEGVFYDGPILSDLYFNNIHFGNGLGNTRGIVPYNDATTYDFDPVFGDPATGNYRLGCLSAGREMADPARIPPGYTLDIDGQSRFGQTGIPDIGGDEFYDENKSAFFMPDATTPPNGCIPLAVTFINFSICVDEEWIWIFGDGDTLTGVGSINENPTHIYDSAGVYTVTLIAKGEVDSDTFTAVNLINVDALISVDFTVDKTLGCDTATVRFIATANTDVDQFDWDFGVPTFSSGVQAAGDTVTFKYMAPGEYTVTLYATNECGTKVVEKTGLITISSKPNIFVTSSHDSHVGPACAPYDVFFDYSSNQPLSAWNWDFGDNETSTDSTPVHTFKTAGTYSVRLIGFGDCGRDTVVRQSYITVTGTPSVTANAAPTLGCDTLTVAFTGTITGAYNTATWQFGDGASGPGPNTTHKYNAIGVYDPFLVVAHNCGVDTLRPPNPVRVSDDPVPAFTVAPDSGYEPLSVTLTDQSANFPTAWNWTLGDGEFAATEDVIHVYDAGVYTVTLDVSNHCGDSSLTRVQPIRVGGFNPIIDSTGTLGDTILFAITLEQILFPYDRSVQLSARLTTTPRRGGANFLFAQTSGTPPFATTMKLVPTGGLAADDYVVELTANDQLRIIKTATSPLNFAGKRLISVNPAPIQFDSTIVGNSSSRFITVKNEAFVGSNLRLDVEDPLHTGSAFQVTGDGGLLLSQNSLTWTVIFTPPRKGLFEGTLRIRSDDPVSPDTVITLTGRGIGEQVPPTVTAVYPDSNSEVVISDSVRLNFSELMLPVPVDTIFQIRSKRADGLVEGVRRWSGNQILHFRPTQLLRPDDTITVTLRALVTDTNGNFLDGNRNGAEQGSPTDDYSYKFRTGPGVYPGDTDNDGIVNEGDVLPLGLFWLETGPARSGPRPGFVIQPAQAWDPRKATYADADGNGIVDSADICPIVEFFDERTGTPKTALDAWLEEASTWPSDLIAGLLGALQDCPTAGAGRLILTRFLDGLQGAPPLPKDYSLAQNYPNPFNAATVIEYTLVESSNIRLEVFDILGRRVRTLESGPRAAGRHAITWDGRDGDGQLVASGVYFYRLSSPHFHFARKMMLLK